jgi:hypothetical protein
MQEEDEMETVVTTYELKENEELMYVPEAAIEWATMVEATGLKGQQKLLTKGTDGSESPIPYLWMNKRMVNVFKVLCPMKESIEEYAKMPIPLLILGHVKQCQMKGYFKKLEVWYDDVQPDPVVVGDEQYLIGRWGAEDRSLEALSAMAFERKKKDIIEKATDVISDAQRVIATPDSEVTYFMEHGYTRYG